MIRGSFRGFVSGWAGIIMISIGLSIIICCFCCWCMNILYSRRSGKHRRGDSSGDDEEKDPSITLEDSQNATTYRPTSSNCIETEKERDTAIDVSWSSATGTGCVASPNPNPKPTTDAHSHHSLTDENNMRGTAE